MRYLLLIGFLLTGMLQGIAQDGEYDKILAMLVDEEYEKVLYKAEPYTLKDETKKDPIPYLYISMAYFEMSKRGEFEEEYPKAFKEALKYASKHRKKDKDNAYFSEFSDYFSELRAAGMVEAEVEMEKEKYTRAKGVYKYLISLDEQDPGAYLMQSYCLFKDNSKKDAGINMEEAKKLLEEGGVDRLAKEQKLLLKAAIINISAYFDSNGMRTEAREWMEIGKEYFSEDDEFMGHYKDIVG